MLAFKMIDLLCTESDDAVQSLAPALVFLTMCREANEEPSTFLNYADRVMRRTESNHLRALSDYVREQVFDK